MSNDYYIMSQHSCPFPYYPQYFVMFFIFLGYKREKNKGNPAFLDKIVAKGDSESCQ